MTTAENVMKFSGWMDCMDGTSEERPATRKTILETSYLKMM